MLLQLGGAPSRKKGAYLRVGRGSDLIPLRAYFMWRYIAQDDPNAADRFIDGFDRVFRKLAVSPGIGR